MGRTTLTDQDLQNIEARNTAAILLALDHHEENCGKKNDKIYVPKGNCTELRDKDREIVFKAINKKKNGNSTPMYELEVQDRSQDPEVTLSVKLGKHKGKILGTVITAESLAIIGLIVTMILDTLPS